MWGSLLCVQHHHLHVVARQARAPAHQPGWGLGSDMETRPALCKERAPSGRHCVRPHIDPSRPPPVLPALPISFPPPVYPAPKFSFPFGHPITTLMVCSHSMTGRQHSRLRYNDGFLLIAMAIADGALFGISSLDNYQLMATEDGRWRQRDAVIVERVRFRPADRAPCRARQSLAEAYVAVKIQEDV